MGTLQTASIRRIVEELYTGFQEDNEDLCATFEVHLENTIWVQLVIDALNLSWPYDEAAAKDLERTLTERLGRCKIIALEAGTFATFEIDLPSTNEMACLIDWLFTDIFKASPTYTLDSKILQL